MIDLYDFQLHTIFFIGLAALLAGAEIGIRLGLRIGSRSGDSVSTLESAMLGLLALMIGFTFAMALTRFDARRDAVLNEANAIGTTALRARLLPAPHNTEILKLLQEYVQIRLNITQRIPSRTELNTALVRSNAIQEAIWQQAQAVVAKDNGMVPTGLFIQTLNEMIDNQAKHLAALRNRVPNTVLITLYAVATIVSAFAGYASALEARRTRLPVYIMGLLVSAVILLILDLDRPSDGFIDVSQQPMIDTAAGIESFTK